MNFCETQSLERAAELVADMASDLRQFYVYMLIDNRGETFYVGKGSGLRFQAHRSRWGNYSVSFAGFCIDEESAFDLERRVITLGRREAWPLRNKTGGGQTIQYRLTKGQIARALAHSNSPENRESKRQKALVQWATRRNEMVLAIKHRCTTEEFREKMRYSASPEVRSRAAYIRWNKREAE